MKNTYNTLTLVLFALAVATPSFAAPSAESARPRTITVSAEGVSVVRPDLALVRLGAETRAPSVKDAFSENRDLMAAIRSALRDAGVAEKDETTINFSVQFEQPYQPDIEESEKQGYYRVTNGLAVAVRDMDTLGPVIDAAVEAGANQLWGVEFVLEDRAAAEEAARQAAVKSVIAKARILAEATGVTLGELESLIDIGIAFPGPLPSIQLKAMVRSADASSAVSPGETELRVGVQAVFRIR
ncbi:MAG TPA: hypothetical protein DIC34_03590 [Treponema sp.]|nr:MAG: hypothetical protein A2001_18080 [Treponema sp. GWC1_61_84]OHE75963.1 MAG: hypothetical protein A2413_13545 [Treponema sp. RIFOXYC1_FULL_61_9]HCM25624.1 hypothetical protein [Treponema sp.]